MIDPNYKYSAQTSKIIGCAMEVHKNLGNGFTHLNRFLYGIHKCYAFQEVIYQRALAIEFEMQGIDYKREFEIIIQKKSESNTQSM